jgi:hypothetical protein
MFTGGSSCAWEIYAHPRGGPNGHLMPETRLPARILPISF